MQTPPQSQHQDSRVLQKWPHTCRPWCRLHTCGSCAEPLSDITPSLTNSLTRTGQTKDTCPHAGSGAVQVVSQGGGPGCRLPVLVEIRETLLLRSPRARIHPSWEGNLPSPPLRFPKGPKSLHQGPGRSLLSAAAENLFREQRTPGSTALDSERNQAGVGAITLKNASCLRTTLGPGMEEGPERTQTKSSRAGVRLVMRAGGSSRPEVPMRCEMSPQRHHLGRGDAAVGSLALSLAAGLKFSQTKGLLKDIAINPSADVLRMSSRCPGISKET